MEGLEIMALVCDRCGNKIPPRKDGSPHTTIIFIPAGEDELPEFDICVGCTQEFRGWVSGSPLAHTGTRTRADVTPDTRPRSP